MDFPNDMYRSTRPWGFFEQYTHNADSCTVKTLVLNKGQRLSLQSHERRDELWVCIRGRGHALIDGTRTELMALRKVWIPRGTPHRLCANEHVDEQLIVLEIAFGEFEEDDEVRLEDDYGRVAQSPPKG